MLRRALYGCTVFLWMMGFWSCDSTSDRSVSLLRSSPEQSSGPQHTVTLRLPAFFPAAEASVYLLEDPSFTLSVHRQTDSQGHLKIPADGRYVVGVVVSDGRVGLISDGRWEKDVWEVSPLPKAPRAKPVAAGDLRGDIDGSGRVDEIDVIFLFAWLAAQAELPGSRPELGDIDDDDDVDWLDLALLGAYVHTEETPTENPYGNRGINRPTAHRPPGA